MKNTTGVSGAVGTSATMTAEEELA